MDSDNHDRVPRRAFAGPRRSRLLRILRAIISTLSLRLFSAVVGPVFPYMGQSL